MMWKVYGHSLSTDPRLVRAELKYYKIPTNSFRFVGPDKEGFYKIEVWIE